MIIPHSIQDKKAEIELFNSFSGPRGYDVFDEESKNRGFPCDC